VLCSLVIWLLGGFTAGPIAANDPVRPLLVAVAAAIAYVALAGLEVRGTICDSAAHDSPRRWRSCSPCRRSRVLQEIHGQQAARMRARRVASRSMAPF
jgi:hypothetical protein